MSNQAWPIFFKENLKIGNLDSSIGICTLWTRKEIIHNNLRENKYAICGNLYTIQGINPMIKNILANPKIRQIVLCGADLMKSGDALINFLNNGIDENRKIINSSGFIDSNIDHVLIEKFRENINIIDMRGKEDEIVKKIDELKDLPPFSDPVYITKLETTTTSLYSDEVGFKVNGKSVAETWLKVLDVVVKFGEEKPSEYEIKQKEIVDLVAIIDGDDEKLEPWLNLTEKDLENYFATFFSAEKPKGVAYTYGERLFKYTLSSVPDKFLGETGTVINQIEIVSRKLKEAPYTRRAVAFTLKELDPETKHPPCLTQITWNIKNHKLYQSAIFRSHDVFGAWCLNAFALRKLQKEIAKKVGVEIGSLIIVSNSAHIYENNWGEAKGILDKYYTGGMLQFEQDKDGYFIITVENGEIVVQHHLPDGRKSDYLFRGKKAQVLYRQILHENLVSRMDHAAYLGHELARAEIALKENKTFEQDEA